MLRSKLSGSLAVRIALASALFGLVVAGGAVAVGYWALAEQLDVRSATRGKRDLLTHILSEIPTVEAVDENHRRFGDLLIGHDDVHVALVDGSSTAAFS